jgi:hypothetical protein
MEPDDPWSDQCHGCGDGYVNEVRTSHPEAPWSYLSDKEVRLKHKQHIDLEGTCFDNAPIGDDPWGYRMLGLAPTGELE